MKIQQNMDVQNSFIQDQTGVNSASKSHTNITNYNNYIKDMQQA